MNGLAGGWGGGKGSAKEPEFEGNNEDGGRIVRDDIFVRRNEVQQYVGEHFYLGDENGSLMPVS